MRQRASISSKVVTPHSAKSCATVWPRRAAVSANVGFFWYFGPVVMPG